MKPIRVYDVVVMGYPARQYSARSPAKARYQAWLNYSDVFDGAEFKDFCEKTYVRLSPFQGAIARVLVCGKPATRIWEDSDHHIKFIYDGSDVVMRAHPSEVKPLSEAAKDGT